MGNTVGSTNANFCNFLKKEEDAYILGLWCADSYWWSSSIGLSNTDKDLIKRFNNFLLRIFPKERIRFNRNHLFVNSRPLLREFRLAKTKLSDLTKIKSIRAYIAGRFDGDGCINKNLKKDCRIVYGYKNEAELDQDLLRRIGITKTNVYYYRTSNTFCLYVSRYDTGKFIRLINLYSTKLQKLAFVSRRDLALSKA